jgi:hypothetical protein
MAVLQVSVLPGFSVAIPPAVPSTAISCSLLRLFRTCGRDVLQPSWMVAQPVVMIFCAAKGLSSLHAPGWNTSSRVTVRKNAPVRCVYEPVPAPQTIGAVPDTWAKAEQVDWLTHSPRSAARNGGVQVSELQGEGAA